MGIVYRGIPKDKALDLARKFNLKFFVETGTLVGSTTKWASVHFSQVTTIECSKEYAEIAIRNLKMCDNVKIILSKSELVLYEVLMSTHGLALVWLDAHWSRDLKYQRPEVICPVLDEIKCVRTDGRNHVIMVDDVRLFNGKKGWPSHIKMLQALSYDDREVSVIDDVYISEPCLL